MRSDVQLRHAVAVVIRRHDGRVLAVRRPDEPGEELPGVWGLPATTLRAGESDEDALLRIGREKLSVTLRPVAELASGDQRRPGYTLRMTVYEAVLQGDPALPTDLTGDVGTLYDALEWRPASALNEAAGRGSLCCRLFLDSRLGS